VKLRTPLVPLACLLAIAASAAAQAPEDATVTDAAPDQPVVSVPHAEPEEHVATPGTESELDADAADPDLELDAEPPAVVLDTPAPEGSAKIVYVVERVAIRGNRTSSTTIRRFIPFKAGDPLDVDDPEVERIRYRLLGTGWFDDVRLSLSRGKKRGAVVLVVEVKERNTITVNRVIAGLSRVVTSSRDRDDHLRPYGGLGIAESNLFGLGVGLSLSGVVSADQGGVDLRYHDPLRLGGGFDLDGRVFYNHAREFFGRDPLVVIECPAPTEDEIDPEECDPDVLARRAVVIYDRVGVGLGTGHEITSALRYEIDWLGELVDVQAKPRAASSRLGKRDEEVVPIDFKIDDAVSRVSSLHLGFVLDRRDDPALPQKGQLVRFDARIGSGLLGSTYDFARIEVAGRHFQRLPWRHVLSVGAMFGAVLGRAPFFYRYYAADLTDLLPSRALELNLDHRRTHNLLGTNIREFDKTDFGARLDVEYQLPLLRNPKGFARGIDLYLGGGVFALAELDQLRRGGPPGYDGFERLPLDLTMDLGMQADTAMGVFRVGFSTLIGFLPDFGRENR
jgi:hypothetical protein